MLNLIAIVVLLIGKKARIDRAIADYDKAIELKPDFVKAHYNRGIAYIKKGNFDRAIVGNTKAIELKRDLVEAYNNRGNAYTKKGEINRAIEDYNRAIELKPDLAESYAGRGEAWLHLREWEKARADLKNCQRTWGWILSLRVSLFLRKRWRISSGRNEVKLPEDLAAMLTPQQ